MPNPIYICEFIHVKLFRLKKVNTWFFKDAHIFTFVQHVYKLVLPDCVRYCFVDTYALKSMVFIHDVICKYIMLPQFTPYRKSEISSNLGA